MLVAVTNCSAIALNNVHVNGHHAVRQLDVANATAGRVAVTFASSLGRLIRFRPGPPPGDAEGTPLGGPAGSGQWRAAASAAALDTPWGTSASFSFETGSRSSEDLAYPRVLGELDVLPSFGALSLERFGPDARGSSGSSTPAATAAARPALPGTSVVEDDGGAGTETSVELAPHATARVLVLFRPEDQGAAGSGDEDASGLDGVHEFADVAGSVTLTARSCDVTGDPQVVTLPFRARVCRSVAWSDVAEVAFDECVAGCAYFRDFSVYNRSEIDLVWDLQIVADGDAVALQLVDGDSGEPLQRKPLGAFGRRRVRLVCRPQREGSFSAELVLTNLNNAHNVFRTPVRVNVRFRQREERLIVASGHQLDFGAFSAGTWCIRELQLRNISDVAIDVRFGVVGAGGAAVVFQVSMDDWLAASAAPPAAIGGGGAMTGSSPSSPVPTEEAGTPPAQFYAPVGDVTADFSTETSPVAAATMLTLLPPPVSELGVPPLITTGGDGSFSSDAPSTLAAPGSVPRPPPPQPAPGRAPGKQFAAVDEIHLLAGQERIVRVCYLPPARAAGAPESPALVRHFFQVDLAFGPSTIEGAKAAPREHKRVQGSASFCDSLIRVEPAVLDFGSTDVGAVKSEVMHVHNLSDVAAVVDVVFVSKVLACDRRALVIAPRQTAQVRLDLCPRKAGQQYRKQISIVNRLNRANDQTLQVHGRNVDKQRVTFHSLFYRLVTPLRSNFCDFGNLALNSVGLRTIALRNVTQAPLVLNVSSSAPDLVRVYIAKGSSSGSGPHLMPAHRRERLLEALDGSVAPQAPLVGSLGDGGLAEVALLPQAAVVPGSVGGASVAVAATPAPTVSAPPNNPAATPDLSTVRPARIQAPETPRDDLVLARWAQGRAADSGHSASTEYLDLALWRGGPVSPRRRLRLEATPDGSGDAPGDGESLSRRPSLLQLGEAALGGNEGLLGGGPIGGNVGNGAAPTGDSGGPQGEVPGPGPLQLADVVTPSVLALAESGRMPIETLLAVCECVTGTAPAQFPKHLAEEVYVRLVSVLESEMRRLVRDGQLVRAGQVTVPAGGETTLIVLCEPRVAAFGGFVQGKPKKMDARLLFELVSFDAAAAGAETPAKIPIRELVVRSAVCRSLLELGQRNINFGAVDRGGKRQTRIVVKNRSEMPLLYAIHKSGSIASGDIAIQRQRYGVVRGYGEREVLLQFEPTLAGAFNERIVVENVLDREHTLDMVVKAHVRKPSSFAVRTRRLDVGSAGALPGLLACVEPVLVHNTAAGSRHARQLEVWATPVAAVVRGADGLAVVAALRALFKLEVVFARGEDVSEDGAEDAGRAARDEIEELEQKLKIAERKGRAVKARSIGDRIEQLKRVGSVQERSGASSTSLPASPTARRLLLSLDPLAGAAVHVWIAATARVDADGEAVVRRALGRLCAAARAGVQIELSASVCVNEVRNSDVVRVVQLYGTARVDAAQLSAVSPFTQVLPDDRLPDMREPPVKFDRVTVDLRRVVVHTRRECYVSVTNRSADSAVVVQIRPAASSREFGASDGRAVTVGPGEAVRVPLTLTLEALGRQTLSVAVAWWLEGSVAEAELTRIAFVAVGIESAYLRFPALERDSESRDAPAVLDLGVCYVDASSQFARVKPLVVANVAESALVLRATSNLAQQCVLFHDAALQRPVTAPFPLPRGGRAVVYVAIQAGPLRLRGSGSTAEDVRTLIGGIKFAVYAPEIDPLNLPASGAAADEAAAPVMTQVVKVTATLGTSVLLVPEPIVDLGIVAHGTSAVAATVLVRNPGALPAAFSASLPETVSLDARDGVLAPGGSVTLHATCRCPPRGLFSETLTIRNTHNGAQTLRVEIRFLVDPGLVAVLPKGLEWPEVLLATTGDEAGVRVVRAGSGFVQFVTVTTCSQFPVTLQPLANLDVATRWVGPDETDAEAALALEAAVATPSKVVPVEADRDAAAGAADANTLGRWYDGSWRSCGDSFTVSGTGRLAVAAPVPEAFLAGEPWKSALLGGRRIQTGGLLRLDSMDARICAALVPLAVALCVPAGSVAPRELDLGVVGGDGDGAGDAVAFAVQLANAADAPLSFEVAASDDAVQLLAVDGRAVSAAAVKRIGRHRTRTLQFQLDPTRLRDARRAGPREVSVSIRNVYNPANDAQLRVTLRMHVALGEDG